MDAVHTYFIEQLSIDPARIPIVVLAAIGIYIFFLILVRIFGVRIMAKMTAFDTIVLIMFGSVAGRVVVGHPPTFMAGAIGLLTLMLLEAIFGVARNQASLRRVFDEKPHAMFIHGKYLQDEMRRCHVSRSDIRIVMRRAGILHLDQVQLIILEPTGEMSLFRSGDPIDAELLKGVRGIPAEYWNKA